MENQVFNQKNYIFFSVTKETTDLSYLPDISSSAFEVTVMLLWNIYLPFIYLNSRISFDEEDKNKKRV